MDRRAFEALVVVGDTSRPAAAAAYMPWPYNVDSASLVDEVTEVDSDWHIAVVVELVDA